MGFSTIEITSTNVCGNDVDISNSEIAPEKVGGKNVDFWTTKITPKKERGNDVGFWTIEISVARTIIRQLVLKLNITPKRTGHNAYNCTER